MVYNKKHHAAAKIRSAAGGRWKGGHASGVWIKWER